MSDVQLYSDVNCTQKLDVTDSMVSVSGVTSHGGGEKGLAVDDSTSTSWRPQCHPCSEGEAWLSVTFATPTEVQCGKADICFYVKKDSATTHGFGWLRLATAGRGRSTMAGLGCTIAGLGNLLALATRGWPWLATNSLGRQ